MVPFATPYKTIFFKYIHNNLWYAVFVSNVGILVFALACPLPIVGVNSVEVDGHTKTMHAVPVGAADIAPQKGTSNIADILF